MWRFVNVMFRVMIDAGLPIERHEEQPEHIEGRHPRDTSAEQPQQDMTLITRKRLPEDFIFREKAGQARRAGNGQSADEHRPERNWNFVLQGSHLAHVLLMMHCMNHTARAKEQ